MNNTIKFTVMGILIAMLLVTSSILAVAVTSGKGPVELLFPVGEAEAITIVSATSDANVEEVELEGEAYEVDADDGKEYTVDANTGEITTVEEDLPNSAANGSPVSESEAKAIAVAEVGGEVTDFEVERRNGNIVYEVEIQKNGKEADVHVDAQTGKIVEIEWDDESDEDDD